MRGENNRSRQNDVPRMAPVNRTAYRRGSGDPRNQRYYADTPVAYRVMKFVPNSGCHPVLLVQYLKDMYQLSAEPSRPTCDQAITVKGFGIQDILGLKALAPRFGYSVEESMESAE